MGIRITIIREENTKAEPWARRLTRRSIAALSLVTATLLAAAGVAVASIPADSSGTLHGCYATRTGVLRLLTAVGESCRPGERAVSWGQSGFHWRGGWHSGASYSAGDGVSYQGSSYIATAASTGKVPSLSNRFWSVLAASGQQGPPGPPGAAGALASAYFYDSQTGFVILGPNQALPFNHAGPSTGSGISQASATTFQLAEPGTYEVQFEIPIEDDGEFELALNGTTLPSTAAGTEGIGPGNQLIAKDALILTTAPDQTLSVVNTSGFSVGLNFFAPGSDPLTASLVIKLLSH